MRLDTEFIQLPLRFDAARLAAEVRSIREADWRPHPEGHRGNSALPLVARDGDPRDDDIAGTMLPTPHLAGLPYLRQVLASLGTVIGRARLMRLDGRAQATTHVDTNYYWAERVRVHIPVITDPAITFLCAGRSLHMAPGECWIFDAWRRHNVLNPTGERRIHLVADTVGSARFWELVARGCRPEAASSAPFAPAMVAHDPAAEPALVTERSNLPVVMSPWEQQRHAAVLAEEIAGRGEAADRERFGAALERLQLDWREAWARHGEHPDGWEDYIALRERCAAALAPLAGRIELENGTDAVAIAHQWILRAGLTPRLAAPRATPPGQPPLPPPGRGRRPAVRARVERAARRFERPLFVVSPPRSGSTLLFELLATSPDLWSLGGESHAVIESIAELHPAAHGWDGNRLTAHDARPAVADRLREQLFAGLRDRDGHPPAPEAEGLRLLEKTPKNALRIPFLDAVFPDAVFVYLYRDPRACLASMLEAWESGRFVTYPQLPGWPGPPWSLLLTPGWREQAGRPPAEVVAAQWEATTRTLLADLEALAPERWCAVGYDELVADPGRELARLWRFAGVRPGPELRDPPPPSAYTVTPPRAEKWRAREAELAPVLDRVAEAGREAHDWIAAPEAARARAARRRPAPLSGTTSASFGELLEGLGCSLVVSTYQAGKLVVLRRAGRAVNTHFRDLPRPMGIAARGRHLAVGTSSAVVEYRNLPEVAARLGAAPATHDACYVPHRTRTTGDLAVHDLAWAGEELWLVATRFSCLATLDDHHSFVPRWQPPFVSGLAAEDRCHLNGLAVRDEQPAYVTALGATDTPGGWRAGKAEGGVLLDVGSGETAVAGLCMPHSPRWHRGALWVLESGRGRLSRVDLDTGAMETVVELPGFTRGLAFAGPVAFVGLSQVREGASFGGLPITARAAERRSGVWAVDLDSGSVLAFLRFEQGVEELFDLEVLPGARFPEIAEAASDATRLAYVVPDDALSNMG